MNRFDRALAILLALRGGKTLSAAALAARFSVSPRTIYRDVETLSALGVPVYAEMGRAGGFRLLPGYFLPPLMFSTGEAVALFLALTLSRSLPAMPFATERETAEQKLLMGLPEHLRAILTDAQTVIGFEHPPDDLFHPEPADSEESPQSSGNAPVVPNAGVIATVFLQAVLDRRILRLDYRSPYRAQAHTLTAVPLGMFWDRDRWYLAGVRAERPGSVQLWRADRVRAIAPLAQRIETAPAFDVRQLLGRTWLHTAMTAWREEAPPVVIRMTPHQATRLARDWYYRHAHYEECPDGTVRMTIGESDRALVLELVRWLGPGAELLSPPAWRAAAKADLAAMLASYADA